MYKSAVVPSLLTLTLCFLLSGCGIIDHFYLPPADDTVQEMFESANDAMRDKNYVQAAEYYSRIKDNFPFSPYAIEAELSLGDAYFLDEKYTEAGEAYRDFETLHPRHEAIPYVLFQLGLSLRKSYVSVDKAASDVTAAIEFFQRLQQSYPNTEYGMRATEEIAACRRLLALREVYIGDVFWNMGNYQASWSRFQYVVDNFPDIADAADYARQKGEVAYKRYRGEASEDVRGEVENSFSHILKEWL
jgi:outer membrane protein assembly factor BamD